MRNREQNGTVLINITHNINHNVAAQTVKKNFRYDAPFIAEVLYGNAFTHKTTEQIV